MRQLSVVVVFAVGLMVAGCVTVANNLKPEEVRSFKLTEVTVGFDEAPVISWDQGLKDYAAANGISLLEVMSKGTTASLQQYLRDQLSMRIKSTLERDLRGWMDGTRPVRLEIVVKTFVIASAVQRIVIGGNHVMVASATLVDARTGKTIITNPKLSGVIGAAQGWAGVAVEAVVEHSKDPDSAGLYANRVIGAYSNNFRSWLFKSY